MFGAARHCPVVDTSGARSVVAAVAFAARSCGFRVRVCSCSGSLTTNTLSGSALPSSVLLIASVRSLHPNACVVFWHQTEERSGSSLSVDEHRIRHPIAPLCFGCVRSDVERPAVSPVCLPAPSACSERSDEGLTGLTASDGGSEDETPAHMQWRPAEETRRDSDEGNRTLHRSCRLAASATCTREQWGTVDSVHTEVRHGGRRGSSARAEGTPTTGTQRTIGPMGAAAARRGEE